MTLTYSMTTSDSWYWTGATRFYQALRLKCQHTHVFLSMLFLCLQNPRPTQNCLGTHFWVATHHLRNT